MDLKLNPRIETPEQMDPYPLRTALKVALGYALVGWIWILTSDLVVSMLTQDPDTMVTLNSAKGSAFILVTAAILFFLVYTQLRQVQGAQQRYVSSVQELEAAQQRMLTQAQSQARVSSAERQSEQPVPAKPLSGQDLADE